MTTIEQPVGEDAAEVGAEVDGEGEGEGDAENSGKGENKGEGENEGAWPVVIVPRGERVIERTFGRQREPTGAKCLGTGERSTGNRRARSGGSLRGGAFGVVPGVEPGVAQGLE